MRQIKNFRVMNIIWGVLMSKSGNSGFISYSNALHYLYFQQTFFVDLFLMHGTPIHGGGDVLVNP